MLLFWQIHLNKNPKEKQKEQEKANQRSFTYISADKGFPLIPSGYINSKREAEIELEKCRDISGLLL